MKNLSAIPRLPLSEAFTILITLVVCLAGFTEAEIRTNYEREISGGQEDENFLTKESSYKENDPYINEASNVKGDELKQNQFAYLKSLPELSLDKLIKRHSDYFGESDESDRERENDGYGYDDDEYYHFNNKRNEEMTRNIENSNKINKEGFGSSNQKELYGHKSFSKNANNNNNDKEIKTVEILNFKEIHPNDGAENAQNPLQNQKPFSLNDMTHKKTPASDALRTLNILDLKENSALEESVKDRKEESGGVIASASTDSKLSDAKKVVKTNDDKDSSKVKDSKLNEDTEKKDKEASLKEGKETVAAKNLKEPSKTTEDKEKNVKLSESAKLEENMKSKVGEIAKITKEDKDISKFTEKMSAESINPNEISQINNRASFVSNDYKDNLDAIKNLESQGEEKSSEEMNENDKSIGLNEYQQNYKENQRQYKEKGHNLRKSEGDNDLESLNNKNEIAKVAHEESNASPYFTVPMNFEYQKDNSNEVYNKRESWKNQENLNEKMQDHQQQALTPAQALHISQEQLPGQQQQQQQQQPQLDMSYENQKNPYPVNFPANELENTDYRKNYLKYLKKYKSQSENTKGVIPEPPSSSYQTGRKASSFLGETENKKRKRSKLKKRRSMLSQKPAIEKGQTEEVFSNVRRNKLTETFSDAAEKCVSQPHDSQSFSTETTEEDMKLSDGKKSEEQSDSSRLKRKSPQKLEYEIKVINQNQHDPKNVQFSSFSPMRLKKNVKTKMTDSKYLKKYPYSQVSRDDLMRLNKKSDSENEKKYKRKAPLWKRHDQKSVIRTRAAPSGYYSNRVKFGQKNCVRNNDKTNSDAPSTNEMNRISVPYINQAASAAEKTNQRSWEPKQQTFKHDPMKRFDENALLNEGNSLFLVKKGDQTAKSFEESSNNKGSDELDPDQLAKILSKANDYVVLKKTENNKFRKISDHDSFAGNPINLNSLSFYSKKSNLEGKNLQEGLRNAGKQSLLKNKNLRSRSPNSDKEDKKLSATFRTSSSKSNLKKTFDKFRDLADFFKDNEQDSTDNQNSPQEIKEGRDIVFSEDKLPDPIVINSDGEKNEGLKQKPLNSIYSISTNFKNIDQPDRKNEVPNTSKNLFTSGVKADSTEFSWEPALKNAFPEAKSINSINKNGNEIIVLDFNRNQLKTDHGLHAPQKMSKGQPYGMFGATSHGPGGNPMNILGDRKVKVILGDSSSTYQAQRSDINKNDDKRNRMSDSQNRGYSVITNQLTNLPKILKSITEKNEGGFNEKSVKKKSEEDTSQNNMSENYQQFLRDLSKLSEVTKSSFIKKNPEKLSKKRSVNEIILPSSSFSELSAYSDNNIRKLGNLLENILTRDSTAYTNYDNNNKAAYKNSEEYEKNNLYQKNLQSQARVDLKSQGQWLSSNDKIDNKAENAPEKDREEISNNFNDQPISSERMKNIEELWKERASWASGALRRKRREEVENKQLKKAEDALPFKESQERLEFFSPSDIKMQEKRIKLSADSNTLDSKNLEFAEEEEKSVKDSESHLKNTPEEKYEEEKPDYDSHLSGFFGNFNRNQKNPSESAWNRKKRKINHRQKRFSRRDDEDKVSKTEVQNTILKNLPEDNYQSVYSPGIKRKLLSTNNEAENGDSYSDADELDKNIAEEAQRKCEKNAVNKCVDPLILELFATDGSEEEKNRARRSLTSSFHSDFKREIDLDESMPNDFQNFLVTSLGGFGSQKREVIKRDEPFWEGKESSPNNYNQIAESSPNGKEGYEDSPLEKREVSSSDNRNGKSYKNSALYRRESESDSDSDNDNDRTFSTVMNSLNPAQKQTRSDDKAKLKSKTSEFTDEKLPTQIRIQITNASSKEKKSSKPIMDENETTSTEMENLPKEKEFFDKNKINPLLSKNLPKLHQTSKNKIAYNDYEEDENKDTSRKQNNYGTVRRKKRKKKKYISENPIKPIKDFISFDQKAIESLLRRYYSNQNMMSDQTTQKSPVSNHLPQVETVYNPTQGTNKAQLETSRLGKINSINNKNAESSKNSLQSNDASTYDENIIRSFLKAEKMKSDQGELKDFDNIDWKPYSGRNGLGRDSMQNNQFGIFMHDQKTSNPNPVSFNTKNASPYYLIPYSQHFYNQKLLPRPQFNYFYQSSSHPLYGALQLKQELKNRNLLNKDPVIGKFYIKPFYPNEINLYNKVDEKEKQETQLPSYLNPTGRNWNNFDYNFAKKPFVPKFQIRDYHLLTPKLPTQTDPRTKNFFLESKKFKNLESDKPLNSPHLDYLNTFQSDYLDADLPKESQNNDQLLRDISQKSSLRKAHETPNHLHLYCYKNSDGVDNLNEDEEMDEEDYEENADDEELDDYSDLANLKAIDSDLLKASHGITKIEDIFSGDELFGRYGYFYPQIRGTNFDLTKIISNPQDKLDQGIEMKKVRKDIRPITESTNLLRKSKENSNLFGKNLMKNINLMSDDKAWSLKDKIQDDKSLNDIHPMIMSKIQKRKLKDKIQDDKSLNDIHPMIMSKIQKRKLAWDGKLKQYYDLPQIGSRFFYAKKAEIYDDKDILPSFNFQSQQSKNNRPDKARFSRGNPFSAEFVGLENYFETEEGENQKYFNGNLMASEKNKNLANKSYNEKDFLKDEQSNAQDVKENLEGNSGTVSQDNFLENVIGKYIMRKSVKSSTNLKKNSIKQIKHGEELNDLIKHKIKRRSAEKEILVEKSPKILKKRLSSGHLTENNFRKFHKKNFNKKRHIKNLDSGTYPIATNEQNLKKKDRIRENGRQQKRSAFDLFKKITNKDRDNKKAENADGRTAGFEPLMSLDDKKYDSFIKESKDSTLFQDTKLSSDSSGSEVKSLPELKAHYPNEGQQYLKGQLSGRKEKSKEASPAYSSSPVQGPWKIELDDKYNFGSRETENPEKQFRKNYKNVRVIETMPIRDESENLRAFLVISKNVNAVKRNSEEGLHPAFGSFLREVGNSYRPKSDAGRGISKKQVRKRSLECRITSRAEDAAKTSGENTETHVNLEENNRALHDTMSLFGGHYDPQAPRDLQRNIQKITADEQFENSQFLPKERLTHRMSVFQPLSDANIIRDSRHVNEETSEYLGQQIVGAILSHVSTNPKFKEIIAPGLVMRAAVNKESVDYNKKRALHQVEFSEQFQTFLKKFMFDLEKLVEKHVKKRMCHQIDRQSKMFLQSLLNVPIENLRKKKLPKTVGKISSVSQSCSETEASLDSNTPSFMEDPTTVNSSEAKENLFKLKQRVTEKLKAKQRLLLKLLNDFQNLSEAEKDTLTDNYRFLLQELYQTNKELETPRYKPHLITFSEAYEKINLKKKTHNSEKSNGFKAALSLRKKKLKQHIGIDNGTSKKENNAKNSLNVYKENDENNANSNDVHANNNANSAYPNYVYNAVNNPNDLHNIYICNNPNDVNNVNNIYKAFSASDLRNQNNANRKSNNTDENNESNQRNEGNNNINNNGQPPTQYPCFYPNYFTNSPQTTQPQKLPVMYFSEIKNPNVENRTTTSPSPFEKVQPVNATDHKENELDYKYRDGGSNSEEKSIELKDAQLSAPTPQTFDLLPYQSTTILPPKVTQAGTDSDYAASKNGIKNDNLGYEDYLHYDKASELNKLSLGDAAGLQLSLKNQDPWVSNLDVTKTSRSISDKILISTSTPMPKADIKEARVSSQEKFNTKEKSSLKNGFRNLRSLNEVSNKFSGEAGCGIQVSKNMHPIFPYKIDKKYFIPQKRPFENVTFCKWPNKDIQIFPFQYVLRKSSPPPKKVCLKKNVQRKSRREMNSLKKNFQKKRKKRILHFLIHHPKGFVKKLKKSKNVKNNENPNLL